ncbi:MAG: CotH kinase family protein [Treponema sp.]|nr:CotH kinase family protein [Treponema sp.]
MKKESAQNKLFSMFVLFSSIIFAFFAGCKINPDSGNSDNENYGEEKEIIVPVSVQPELEPAPLFGEKAKIKNEKPEYLPDEVYYAYDLNGNFSVGETSSSRNLYNGKSIITVIPKGNGLEIIKYHDSIWWYVDIHIYNVSRGIENARITTSVEDNNSGRKTTYFYPFVTAGEEYKIYITKQDENWVNWASYENDSVYVTAIGGMGNYNISKKGYEFDNSTKTVTFNQMKLNLPEEVINNGTIGGGVYKAALWTGDSKWPGDYKLNDSALCLNDNREVADFIKNADTISVSLHYNYGYWDNYYKKYYNYECTFIEGTIYEESMDSSSVMILEGGETIPNVYISTSSGWNDAATYHFGDSWQPARIRIEGIDGTDDVSETSVYLKDRGNSTKWTGKTPFSLKFEEKIKVLGMPKSKRWVLMANYYDRSLIRTDFAGYVGNNVFNSYWNASFTPVNVYVNNRFIGTYDIGESNKIAKQRVDVQSLEDFADGKSDFEDVNDDGKIDIQDAGFMVEIDTAINWGGKLNRENYKTSVGYDGNAAERIYFYSSEYCIPMTLKDPDFGDGKYSDAKCKEYGLYAKSKIDAFEKMLQKKSFASRYQDYIDPLSFIDWYLINEFAKNSDANFQKSVPVTYNPATGKLYMGPNWDFDLGFGNFNHSYNLIGGGSSTVDNPTGWYIWGGKKGCDENALYNQMHGTEVQTWWINRLMESRSFKKAVKARWNDRKLYLLNAINKQIVDYANLVVDYIPANEENLPRLGQYEWNGPSGYASRITYDSEVAYFYEWCMARYKWMDKEINKL